MPCLQSKLECLNELSRPTVAMTSRIHLAFALTLTDWPRESLAMRQSQAADQRWDVDAVCLYGRCNLACRKGRSLSFTRKVTQGPSTRRAQWHTCSRPSPTPASPAGGLTCCTLHKSPCTRPYAGLPSLWRLWMAGDCFIAGSCCGCLLDVQKVSLTLDKVVGDADGHATSKRVLIRVSSPLQLLTTEKQLHSCASDCTLFVFCCVKPCVSVLVETLADR